MLDAFYQPVRKGRVRYDGPDAPAGIAPTEEETACAIGTT